MAKLGRLIDTLETHTRIPALVIEHYASKLAAACHMPKRGADLLPEDAATLIIALAAARAATEAVEVVEAYLCAPMTAPAIKTPIDPDWNADMEAARGSVIACVALVLEQIPSRAVIGLPGTITLKIRRSIEEPFASVYIKTNEDDFYRFEFAPSRDQPISTPWQEWKQIDDALFAAVAELFDEARPTIDERRSPAVH